MYTTPAETYDLIYTRMKDYAREATAVATLLDTLQPHAQAVLDVGCGTGEHARHLAAHGFIVDGVDLNRDFVRLARRKHPAGRFLVGDMRDFHLPHRYDAVVCLFSAIGYNRTLEDIRRTLRCCREHLTPGGVVLVEPWFPPGQLNPLRVVTNTGEGHGVRVSRVARVQVAGRLSRLFFDYQITDASGTRREREVHELGLFTTLEMLQAFQDAGLDATFRPNEITGRGLYVARAAA